MTHVSPTSDGAEGGSGQPVSDDDLRRFGEAVALLGRDSTFIIQSLTDMLFAMAPKSLEKLSESEVRFMIESGAFTADEWAETSASVNRGSLQLGAARGRLLALLETESMETVTSFLGWTEDVVRAAVSEGRLYSVEISGRLRFPTWQFDGSSPTRLLPGLSEILAAFSPQWPWQSTAMLMATPQSNLIGTTRKTPIQWLYDGGDVNAVTQIIESDDW